MRYVICFAVLLTSYCAYALTDYDRQQIINRIQPIGKVRVEGENESPGVMTEKKQVKKEATATRSAKTIYEQYCAVCHRAGVAGAPKFQDASDWASRLNEKGIDGLTTSAIKGINAMPPKGTCSDCSDEDIRKTVEYMVPQS